MGKYLPHALFDLKLIVTDQYHIEQSFLTFYHIIYPSHSKKALTPKEPLAPQNCWPLTPMYLHLNWAFFLNLFSSQTSNSSDFTSFLPLVWSYWRTLLITWFHSSLRSSLTSSDGTNRNKTTSSQIIRSSAGHQVLLPSISEVCQQWINLFIYLFIYLFITFSYWFKLSVIGLISSILSVCFSTKSLSVPFQFLEAARKRSRITTLDCNWNSFENVRSFEFLHWGLFDSST